MHALVFGLIGALLGAMTAQLRPPFLRRCVLVAVSILGLVAVIVVNTLIADSLVPALNDNRALGGGVFLLGQWYVHNVALRRRAA